MTVYHCGASSKDAGKKITSIMQVKDISNYIDIVSYPELDVFLFKSLLAGINDSSKKQQSKSDCGVWYFTGFGD
jgi:hypothetical protein